MLLSATDQISGVLKGVGAELGLLDNKFAGAKAGEKFGETLAGIGKTAAGFALGGIALNIGTDVVKQFEEVLTGTVALGEATRRLQLDIGGSAQSISGMLAVFARFGLSTDDAARSLTIFSKGLAGDPAASVKTLENSKAISGVLKDLNVDATDATGKLRPMNDVLLDVADAFQKSGDSGLAGERARTLFGRAGEALVPVLMLGRDAMLEYEAEAEKFGNTLSQGNVEAIHKFVMEQKTMGEALEGLKIQLGVQLMPLFQELADAGVEWAKSLNADGGKQIRAFGVDIINLSKGLAQAISDFKDLDAWVQKFKPGQAGVEAHNAIEQKAKDIQDRAAALLDWSDKSAQANASKDLTGLNFNVGALNSGLPLADRVADQADRAAALEAKRSEAGVAAGALHLSEQQKVLNDQIAAGDREKAIIQQAITLATRESLDLKKTEAELQLQLLPLKAQQADIDQQLLIMADKRAGLERDAAVTRAQMNANSASDALEGANFEERRLKLKIQADALGGRGVSATDVAELQRIALNRPNLELADLNAGRPVTMAERDRQRAQQQQDLATIPLREQKAAIDESTASLTAQSAAVQREIERQRNQGVVDTTELQKKKQYLDDQLFAANQKKADLADKGLVLTINQTITSTGEIDYQKVVQMTYQATMDGLTQAQRTVDRPAPQFFPGARSPGTTGPF